MSQIPPAPQYGTVYPQPPKKKRTGLVVGLALGAVALFAVCGIGGCAVIGSALNDASTPTHAAASHTAAPAADEPTDPATDDASEPAQLAMSDQLPIQSDDGTQATITPTGPKYETGPAVDYGQGPANGVFVIFTVTVECNAGNFAFSSSDMYVLLDDGTRVEVGEGNSLEAMGDQKLGFAQLNTGQHITGPLAVDMSGRHGELVYDPNASGAPIAQWKF